MDQTPNVAMSSFLYSPLGSPATKDAVIRLITVIPGLRVDAPEP